MSADRFYKALLGEILGNRWCHDLDFGQRRRIQLASSYADLDGVILDGGQGVVCAVQIESRNTTQIRGAILDLAFHPAPQKLFILDRKNIGNKTVDECHLYIAEVWRRLKPINPGNIEIVVMERNEKGLLISALQRLGINCE